MRKVLKQKWLTLSNQKETLLEQQTPNEVQEIWPAIAKAQRSHQDLNLSQKAQCQQGPKWLPLCHGLTYQHHQELVDGELSQQPAHPLVGRYQQQIPHYKAPNNGKEPELMSQFSKQASFS